jgi:hypothetical protein
MKGPKKSNFRTSFSAPQCGVRGGGNEKSDQCGTSESKSVSRHKGQNGKVIVVTTTTTTSTEEVDELALEFGKFRLDRCSWRVDQPRYDGRARPGDDAQKIGRRWTRLCRNAPLPHSVRGYCRQHEDLSKRT